MTTKSARGEAAARRTEASEAGDGGTLSELAYRQIRRDILGGVFAPGEALRLETLKSRYGLSFSPLREALNRLQSERLVVSLALRGFSVAPYSVSEMRDAVETRILIESEALRLSIRRGTDEWEGRIVAAAHALSLKLNRLKLQPSPLSPEESEVIEASHHEFHSALIAACNSPRLIALAEELYAETERYRRPALASANGRNPPRDLVAEHREIMVAALNRDAPLACDLLAAHYRRTAEFIEQVTAKTAA